MKVGTIEAQNGEKVYGKFKTGETHGGFDVHIPLHIVAGAKEGPLLVVHSGLSGLEIEPALILPKVVAEIDPAEVAGTLVVVPLMNTSGFDFEQAFSAWDNKDLNALGRGDAAGTVSEQMIDRYYREVISKADALIEIHSGAQWSYHQYAGVYKSGAVEPSTKLATALGLPHVLVGQPADHSIACAAAEDGKTVVSAHIGGGPGLRDFRDEILGAVRRAVLNGMKHLGMLPGSLDPGSGTVAVLEAQAIVKPTGARGFTFMETDKRGQAVSAGEQIGIVRHPFTGETIEVIKAAQDGVMLHAGASWPVVPEGEVLAILGSLVEEVTLG